MPIYKMDGSKDGLKRYRVRINYVDQDGKEYHGSLLRHAGIRPVFVGPSAKHMEDAASQVLHLKAK